MTSQIEQKNVRGEQLPLSNLPTEAKLYLHLSTYFIFKAALNGFTQALPNGLGHRNSLCRLLTQTPKLFSELKIFNFCNVPVQITLPDWFVVVINKKKKKKKMEETAAFKGSCPWTKGKPRRHWQQVSDVCALPHTGTTWQALWSPPEALLYSQRRTPSWRQISGL